MSMTPTVIYIVGLVLWTALVYFWGRIEEEKPDEGSFATGAASAGAWCLLAFFVWFSAKEPARSDLPPFIRSRAILPTPTPEPAVRLQPIFVPIPEPRQAPPQRAKTRWEDLA